MSKRSLIAGVLTAAVVALAGCGLEGMGPAPAPAAQAPPGPAVDSSDGVGTSAGSESGSVSGSGSGGGSVPREVSATPGGVSAPGVNPAPSMVDATPTMSVELIGSAGIPASLLTWSQARHETRTIASALDGEELYIMVSAGEQRSGGFRVEIIDLEVNDGGILVQATLHGPAPGQATTMALTYPKAFAKVRGWGPGEPSVTVEWK